MVAVLLYRITITLAGILYPAFSSFKAIRRKSHKEYTKWMMYWVVFALFQTVEAVLDTFVSWFPLYYEIKIGFVLWLVLPITEGSKQLYRVGVHPFLLKHEEKIDKHLTKFGQSLLSALKRVSTAGLNRAASTVLTSAIRSQAALAETLLRTQGELANQNGAVNETDGRRSSSSPTTDDPGSPSSPTALEPFEVLDSSEEVFMSMAPVPSSEPVPSKTATSSGSTSGDTLVESKKDY